MSRLGRVDAKASDAERDRTDNDVVMAKRDGSSGTLREDGE